MPNPSYSDPVLIQWMRDVSQRLRNLEWQQTGGVIDPTGALRVKWGLLPSGDYGILLVDPASGAQTEILPLYEGDVLGFESTTSTGYTDLASPGPSFPATIGAFGLALVSLNSYIGVTGVASAQSGGFVGVSIDGAAPTGALDEVLYFAVSSGTEAVGIAGNQSASIIIGGLSPGLHTFGLKYKTVGGASITFGRRFLQVRPL